MSISGELLGEVMRLNLEELLHLNRIVIDQIRSKRHSANILTAIQFKVGDAVAFTSSRRGGQTFKGVVVKKMRSNFQVRVDGTLWTVPPSMLTKEVR